MSTIKSRRPVHIKICNWILGSKKEKNINKETQNRIRRELDIVNFLKTQIVQKISHKLLFTKFERYLMLNQVNPFVVSANKKIDSDSNDWDDDQPGMSSPFYQILAHGALHHT